MVTKMVCPFCTQALDHSGPCQKSDREQRRIIDVREAQRRACEHTGAEGVSNPEHCTECARGYAEAEGRHWSRF